MKSENLAQSIAAFSKKFQKLDDDAVPLEPAPSKEKILQDEINRREQERSEKLRHQYEDFINPRTQDIEQDEEELLKAYELYKKLNEVCVASEKEGSNTRLRAMEFTSPLCRKDDYTLGDQMAFLRLWFLQKEPEADAVPEFIRAENGQFYLNFTARELWSPCVLEKEILQSLEEPPENS